MADESDAIASGNNTAGDPAALHAALDGQSAASAEAREYLRRQSRLVDLQIDSLEKKDAFELSHLRFRQFSDWARFALESTAFLIALVVLLGLGTMIWRAATDHSLVVDAFDVPPGFAQNGLNGEVLARRILNQLHRLQLQSQSARNTGSIRSSQDGRIDFAIPEAGISVLQLQRLLDDWLGHGTHVSGALAQSAGGLTLSVQFGDAPELVLHGAADNIEDLIERSAEQIYARAEPYRYANYLRRNGRIAEAIPQLRSLALTGDENDRKWALQDLGATLYAEGQIPAAVQKLEESIAVDPKFAQGWLGVAFIDDDLGREESALRATVRSLALLRGPDSTGYEPRRRQSDIGEMDEQRAELTGAFSDAIADVAEVVELRRSVFGAAGVISDRIQMAQDQLAAHDVAAAATIIDNLDQSQSPDTDGQAERGAGFARRIWFLHLRLAIARADLSGTLEMARNLDETAKAHVSLYIPIFEAAIDHALAAARLGQFAEAERVIAQTPSDCEPCLRARGIIGDLEGKPGAAAYWFARAIAIAPSIPFADSDWGEMLLHRGDTAGAIAKFAQAHKLGPHFADPLELWGEALMQQNRSDIALAKFAEAAKYAPNWGRLHLEWGKALWWTGDRNGARQQFAIASKLDMSAADKSALARVSGWR